MHSCERMHSIRPLTHCHLYGILDTGYCQAEKMPAMLEELIAGGIHIIQLRAKGYPEDRAEELARALLPATMAAGIPLVVNDWPGVAGRIGAQGTHVGQDDMPLNEARREAGPRVFVGKSTHSVAQAVAASNEGADCIGFGPLFATLTKPEYQPIGTEEIRHVHELISIPVFCIGGIKREHITPLRAAGARRVVIVSGILTAPSPRAYTAECLGLLES